MKILFAVVDGGGNIPPQLAVANALRARGAEVHFIGHRGVRDRGTPPDFPSKPSSAELISTQSDNARCCA